MRVIMKQPHEVSQKKKVLDIYKAHKLYKKLFVASLLVNLCALSYWLLTTYFKIHIPKI